MCNPSCVELSPWAQAWSAVASYQIHTISEEQLAQILRHVRNMGIPVDRIRERFWGLESVVKKSWGKGPEGALLISDGKVFINERKIGSMQYCYRRSLEPINPIAIRMRRYLDNEFFEFSLKSGIAILSRPEDIMVNYFQDNGALDLPTVWSEFCDVEIEKLPALREWMQVIDTLQEKWTGRRVGGPRVGAIVHYEEHAVAYFGTLLGALRYTVSRMGTETMEYAVSGLIKGTRDSLAQKYHGIFDGSLGVAEERLLRFQIRKRGFQALEGLPKSFWQTYTALLRLLKADENKLSESVRRCLIKGELINVQQFPIEVLKEGVPVIVDATKLSSVEEYTTSYPTTKVHDSGTCCTSCGKPEVTILRRSERLLTHPRVVSQHVLRPDYIKECILCQAVSSKARAIIGRKDVVIEKIRSEPIELFTISKSDKKPRTISLECLPLSTTNKAYHSVAEDLATDVVEWEDPFSEIADRIADHSYELLSDDGCADLDGNRLEILTKIYVWMMKKKVNRGRLYYHIRRLDQGRVIADVVKHIYQSFNLWDALYRIIMRMPSTRISSR